MNRLHSELKPLLNNRWLVFVASIWMQACAGTGYLFGSLSPVIKSSLGYNQRQIASMGVAKDLGNSVGWFAGPLCELLPLWAALLIGALQNLVGYGWLWLIVTGKVPVLPLAMMCILIFVGSNGETYYNTAALVACVQNFPKRRGPVVGILKGFSGLSGAIFTQIYTLIHTPDHAALIFMLAVGPTMVIIALMFIVRPIQGGHKQLRSTDNASFTFVYSICMTLAAYILGVMLLEDLIGLSETVTTILAVLLIIIILLPIIIPLLLTFHFDNINPIQESLLPSEPDGRTSNSGESAEVTEEPEVILSEVEEEKPKGVDLLPASERKKRIAHLQAKLVQAAADGAVRVRRKSGPRRGQDFTLFQAVMKADLWLLFFSLLLGSGSGLTVIDNLGQMSQSLGYQDAHIFVSMISIWNFLGRIAGGYVSEIAVRDYVYPRPVALVVFQILMAVGHLFFAMGWPGAMYIGTILIGLGYGAHWSIAPATASELFGVKNFGALYNYLTAANPAGSLIFSGIIASGIYDHEAEKQAQQHQNSASVFDQFLGLARIKGELKCKGTICFFLSSLVMSGFCIIAVVLTSILIHRTKGVYANIYQKPRG